MNGQKEVWLRGELIHGLSPFLQPVADALLQAEEEIERSMNSFSGKLLWKKYAGCACVGFHLRHICGFVDRLLTYAEKKSLSEEQLSYLKKEELPDDATVQQLVIQLKENIGFAIERLKHLPESTLLEPRKVGREGLPSTVIGLCMHAGEHTTRHTGQLLVTAKVLSATDKENQ